MNAVKDRLLEEKRSLLVQVGLLDEESDTLKSSIGDMRREILSEGDTVSVDRSVLARISASARKTLLEIDDALARIEAGAYGDCSKCHKPIPVERLEVRPHARECVRCAS